MSVSPTDGRARRYAHRRPELLAAAADHVLEHGLADLRLRTVAEALGISHRTLLHHFASKEELLSAVLAELRRRDRELISAEAELLAGEAPAQLLHATWRRLSAEASLPYWRLFFEAYGLAVAEPQRYTPFLDGVVSDWLELCQALLDRAGVPGGRREQLATLILGTFRGLLLDLLVSSERARVDAAMDELAALVEAAAP